MFPMKVTRPPVSVKLSHFSMSLYVHVYLHCVPESQHMAHRDADLKISELWINVKVLILFDNVFPIILKSITAQLKSADYIKVGNYF